MMQRLLILFLFAIPAQAQYVQSGSVNPSIPHPFSAGCVESPTLNDWKQPSSYSCTFAKPLTAPCTLMVALRYPNQTITDSQGNTFALATNNPGRYDELWYSTTCASGTDKITISCPGTSPCWQDPVFAEYSGVWVPDQVATEVINVTGTDGYTAPITPTQNGELIIGTGNNHTDNAPGIVGASGFTVRAIANQFIADLLQATAAPVYSEVTYSAPVNWCQFTVSFKPVVTGPLPQPTTITVKGQLLWCAICDSTDNVPAVGNLVVAQTGGPSSTQNISADGTVSVSGTIDIAQNSLEFTIMLTDTNGATQPGATLTLTFPRFELASPGFTLGTITLGVVRIAHTVDASGAPAVRIVDFGPFSLGK